MKDIPDSVERLRFDIDCPDNQGHGVRFGRESKITTINIETIRMKGSRLFLHVSSRTLKLLRSGVEFPGPAIDPFRPKSGMTRSVHGNVMLVPHMINGFRTKAIRGFHVLN
jgi:hypothetical protein